MSFKLKILTGLLMLACLSGWNSRIEAREASLALKPLYVSLLSSSPLALKDILDAQKTSPELIQKYGSLAVTPGEDGGVNVSQVLQILKGQGEDISSIRLIAEKSASMPDPRSVVLKKVQDAVTEWMVEKNGCASEDVTITWTTIPDKIPTEREFSKISVEGPPPHFQIAFQDRWGKEVATLAFDADVSLTGMVLVSKKSLFPGQLVTADDFEETRKPLSFTQDIFRRLSDLGGHSWKLSQGMEAGGLLFRKNIDSVEGLQKGVLVSVISGTQGFQVRALGRVKAVLEGGNVLVENIDSKKEIIAKPIGGGEVEVTY